MSSLGLAQEICSNLYGIGVGEHSYADQTQSTKSSPSHPSSSWSDMVEGEIEEESQVTDKIDSPIPEPIEGTT